MIVWNDAWKEDGWKKTECSIHLILNTVHTNSKNINRQFSMFWSFVNFWSFILAVLSVLQMTLTLGWPAGYSEMVTVFCIVIVAQVISKRKKKYLSFRRKIKISTRNEREDSCNMNLLTGMKSSKNRSTEAHPDLSVTNVTCVNFVFPATVTQKWLLLLKEAFSICDSCSASQAQPGF